MTEQRTRNKPDEQEDNLVGDELDMLDAEVEADETEDLEQVRARNDRLDMRQRIEEKLEERRLMKELNEYEFFDLDDDTLH
jgi:hypothetical protein